ncbi:MAG: hypothetical protein MHPSP_004456, partial [Paramarteilia canceri]
SFDEPDENNGLAHFLEHIIFMGSKKFPDENSYTDYITLSGGDTNAYTSTSKTFFYHTISNDCFEKSID